MFDQFVFNDTRALLILPDGRRLEWSKVKPGIRRFRMPRLAYPYGFDIDGQRYRVGRIQEFPWLPGTDGKAGPMLLLELVAFGPAAN